MAETRAETRRKMKKLLMTLIEGHAFVVFKTSPGGTVEDVLYEGVDTRMFETMWLGMSVDELPRVTPMICGVCSATHHVASVKAADQGRGVEAPAEAWRIRRLINLGIHLNNQVLHPLVFGLPDFLPASVEKRSMFALAQHDPDLVKAGVALMELGHRVVEVYGGRDIHPINAIPGGVARKPPRDEVEKLREKLEKHSGDMKLFARKALDMMLEGKDKIDTYPPGYTYLMALVGEDGGYDIVNGRDRILDPATGTVLAEFRDRGRDYLNHLHEYTVPYSYIRMVTTKWKAKNPREGTIHVSALARANAAKTYHDPEADELRDRLAEEFGRPFRHPLLSTAFRVVESVALYSHILNETRKPIGDPIYTPPASDTGEGAGVIEAPRGTLIHHYVAEEGKATFINIITPTAINAAAIEADLRAYFKDMNINEMPDQEVYAHAAAIVRSYDPCMACATHAATRERIALRIVVADENWKPIRVLRHR